MSKRYYIEVIPQITDFSGTPKQFGVTRYLVDTEKDGLPEVFPADYYLPYRQPVNGVNSRLGFDVSFRVRIVDADVPQAESVPDPIAKPTYLQTEFQRIVNNAMYGKGRTT